MSPSSTPMQKLIPLSYFSVSRITSHYVFHNTAFIFFVIILGLIYQAVSSLKESA